MRMANIDTRRVGRNEEIKFSTNGCRSRYVFYDAELKYAECDISRNYQCGYECCNILY